MKVNWLWDIRASEKEARGILKDEWHPEFYIFAERLFSRISSPQDAFSFIDKDVFCRQWPKIKIRMQKDKWLAGKIVFWDRAYNRIQKEFASGAIEVAFDRHAIARQLRELRNKKGYTQADLAKKLGVIQQYVSKVESGHENFSVDTLREVFSVLDKKIVIRLI